MPYNNDVFKLSVVSDHTRLKNLNEILDVITIIVHNNYIYNCYTADALEALRKGDIDCMFPANFTNYDAEQAELL